MDKLNNEIVQQRDYIDKLHEMLKHAYILLKTENSEKVDILTRAEAKENLTGTIKEMFETIELKRY